MSCLDNCPKCKSKMIYFTGETGGGYKCVSCKLPVTLDQSTDVKVFTSSDS